MLTKLLPHQQYGLKWLLSREPTTHSQPNKRSTIYGAILGDEMGLGKTIQTIALIEQSHLKFTAIFAPASLTHMWKNQIHKFSDKIETHIIADEGDLVEFLRERDRTMKTVVICSYARSFRRTVLSQLPFDRIVCDEAHYFRNPKSRTYKFLRTLQSKSRILLSGTPLQNKVQDIITLINFIAKDEYKLSIENIRLFIKHFMLARTLKSVGVALPEMTEINHENYAPRDNHSVISRVNDVDLKPLVKILRQKQACVFPESLNNTDINRDFEIESNENARANSIIKHVTERNKKCLIFTEFRNEQKYIYNLLKDNFKVVLIHGGVPLEDRTAICEDLSIDILIIQIQTGCVGLNLQHFATIYFTNRQWNPTVIQQAIGRINRIGQKSEMKVYHFTYTNSIEERINYIAQRKLDLIKKILY